MTNKEIQNAYVGDTQVEKIYLGTNIVWPTIPPEPVYSAMPLTFEIISGGTISWERYAGYPTDSRTIQYKKNDGEWTSITSNTGNTKPYVNVVAGDKVEFKGTNIKYHIGGTYNRFVGSATFKAYGNILSLIYGDNFLGETELPSTATSSSNFDSLFWTNTGITDASNIIMPQNTRNSCYNRMFEDCSNLEKAPTLPASQLEPYAYQYMFANCGKLSHVKCLAITISATNCTANWLAQVANTGTFIKHPNATWPTGRDGIPDGWTVEDAVI